MNLLGIEMPVVEGLVLVVPRTAPLAERWKVLEVARILAIRCINTVLRFGSTRGLILRLLLLAW